MEREVTNGYAGRSDVDQAELPEEAVGPSLTTMTLRLSVVKLASAWSRRILEASWGSSTPRISLTASSSETTSHS
jgi:hypothetical protein